jgi:hypothetical protein
MLMDGILRLHEKIRKGETHDQVELEREWAEAHRTGQEAEAR